VVADNQIETALGEGKAMAAAADAGEAPGCRQEHRIDVDADHIQTFQLLPHAARSAPQIENSFPRREVGKPSLEDFHKGSGYRRLESTTAGGGNCVRNVTLYDCLLTLRAVIKMYMCETA
jgi:hypothetical protein